MSLTTEDLQAISRLIIDSISPINADIKSMKTDMQSMKTDVEFLKTDMQSMKTDMQSMKTDVEFLKTDMQSMKTDMQSMKTDVELLKQKITSIDMTLENETNRNIKLIAEGHLDLSRKLDDVLKLESEKEMLLIRVNNIENELRKVKERLNQIA